MPGEQPDGLAPTTSQAIHTASSHHGPGCFRPCPQRTWWGSPHANRAQHVAHVRCSRWLGSPAIQVPACGGTVVSNTASAAHDPSAPRCQ
eukprot:16447409-Heterocapsa_arctica.AAC.1